jgi:hypothetical protein
MEQVAQRAGFGSTRQLRRAWGRLYETAPSETRNHAMSDRVGYIEARWMRGHSDTKPQLVRTGMAVEKLALGKNGIIWGMVNGQSLPTNRS